MTGTSFDMSLWLGRNWLIPAQVNHRKANKDIVSYSSGHTDKLIHVHDVHIRNISHHSFQSHSLAWGQSVFL